MKRTIIIFLLLLTSVFISAAPLRIGIFNGIKISSLVITTESGGYWIVLDSSKKMPAAANEVYVLRYENDSIRLLTLDKNYGKFRSINFVGIDSTSLKLKLTEPNGSAKIYDSNFSFYVQQQSLKALSTVSLEKYVSGVVEAEAGTRHSPEYYKVQAIICRTYALSNLRRHEFENFNLCDQVHCQVYKGNSRLNPAIEAATKETQNLVLVDKKSVLITTAFHSNCGGETCNSEDVWGMATPYLRSVKDTFCLKQRNATWVKKMSNSQWLEYLNQNCKPCAEDSTKVCCAFVQDNRKSFFEINNVQLPVKNMRNDLRLKSAFFSIDMQNDSVVFYGRGYGHGVGLCQEGAIQMANLGSNYSVILHTYYRDIDIINLNQLNFFKD